MMWFRYRTCQNDRMEAAVEMPTVREMVRSIATELPENANWDDVEEMLIVAKKVARGLADVRAGRTFTLEEVRAEFELDPLCE